jgi:hypothetical protein
VFNELKMEWEAPIPMPLDEKRYIWDELTTAWKETPLLTEQG